MENVKEHFSTKTNNLSDNDEYSEIKEDESDIQKFLNVINKTSEFRTNINKIEKIKKKSKKGKLFRVGAARVIENAMNHRTASTKNQEIAQIESDRILVIQLPAKKNVARRGKPWKRIVSRSKHDYCMPKDTCESMVELVSERNFIVSLSNDKEHSNDVKAFLEKRLLYINNKLDEIT